MATRQKLVLLDRDGVVVVNRRTNIKEPADLMLVPGAAAGIAALNRGGFTIAICTNQPEVGRGALSKSRLDAIHEALKAMLARKGAVVETILCCTDCHKNPRLKPWPGMLKEAMERFGAVPADTPFVGDQADDLRAAFHAGCRRVLVRTGLGTKTLREGYPDYVRPVLVVDDLEAMAAVMLQHEKREV